MKNCISLLARAILAPVACFAFISSETQASDAIPWGKVGQWSINVDTSVRGCFAIGSYTQGEIVRIGINRNQKNGYMLVASSKWRSLEEGNLYKLTFQFDAEPPWSGNFKAVKMGEGSPALVINFSDPRFMREFTSKQSLVMHYEGNFVARLPLTASLGAMQSLIQCQDKVDAIASGQTDPFAKGTDPFAKGATGRPPLSLKPEDPFAGSRGRRNSVQADTL